MFEGVVSKAYRGARCGGGGRVVAAGRGRGPPMMGAATQLSRETSTCLRLPSPVLT